MIGKTNLKVLILDTDYYARQAISSYLAWDRRTRVVHLADSITATIEYVQATPQLEWPDVVLLDALAADNPDALGDIVRHLEQTIPDVMTLVLDRRLDLNMLRAALHADANGYLLRDDVRIRIAWAIVWARDHEFVITEGVKAALTEEFDGRLFHAAVLPHQRLYPELPDRVRQALQLCVVEGMSAELAADEMGLSPHTVRSYVKEGYRILEAYDNTVYPSDMSPQERAFMRFTALERDRQENQQQE
ncbi:sigma factor-like helix-turn-helix DNA-binding protein [Aggregatilinea lenta]|uniref:sigma factor-like helix-turn-helix DNA-binding protein n=1 Tax=Aggregatilinea lenta TaxID=913108 RepID=UPI000E5A8EEB|nr:sigma factor-like helix-turn-helix DNA-binding protein [Aggregatilinea lenta]